MFKNELFELRDEWYKGFQSRLIPNINSERIIGVRTPALRNFARYIKNSPEAKEFLNELPHDYYEQNNLHGFLIEFIKDYDECVKELDRFLPYVDNWATCDAMNPKIFSKHHDRLIVDIKRWLKSKETYTVRFGLGMLMGHFLDNDFKAEYLELALNLDTEEYYISMMVAWLFATALAKQYDATLPFLAEHKLDPVTHNRTIKKANESNRMTAEKKAFLKTLKV